MRVILAVSIIVLANTLSLAQHRVEPTVNDPHDAAVYAKGSANLAAMIERGWLVRDDRPSFYVYRLRTVDHEQTGVVAASALKDYLEGRIKQHELTRPAKVEDRARLNDSLGLHPGPLMLTYRARSATRDSIFTAEPSPTF